MRRRSLAEMTNADRVALVVGTALIVSALGLMACMVLA